MSSNGRLQQDDARRRERISTLLEQIPAEDLVFVERYIEFLSQQKPPDAVLIQEEKPTYLHPTVPVPAATFINWLNLLPEGYEGDALADTEALYDE
jgi:hypothetical protein